MKSKFIKANVMDSCMRIMEDNATCNTWYILLYVKDDFNIKILAESIKQAVKDIPILSCKISRGYWRDKWVPIENLDVNQFIKTICVDNNSFQDKDSFYDEAYNQFIQLKDKYINIQSEPPFKVKIFYNEQIGNKMIAFCLHHCLADGRGWLQAIKIIGEYYNAILNNTTCTPPRRNVRKISKLVFSISMANFFETISLMRKKVNTMEPIKPVLELDNINDTNIDYNNVGIEKIMISNNDLNKLKDLYKPFKFTVNDIFLYLVLKLTNKYNMDLEEPNSQLATGMLVDLRRYFKEDALSIANYFAPEPVMINSKDIDNLYKISEDFKALKKRPLGLGFFYPILLTSIFPVGLLEKIMSKIMNGLAMQSYSGMGVTNFGKLDDYLKPFGEGIDSISVIPSAGVHGFPSLLISGYKGTLTLYFVKYNDRNCLTQKIKNEFTELLNEILAKDKVKQ
ncbi:MAG: siderophore/surfactin biosynthesis protein [Clostridia bacterium]|jgi:NRPS condensation-like uncharacterized protein|uniref:hypothetical protein n=1 Tax=Petroclostridium xylanilyticum TaxID=1792311 RepID=UPI000B995DE5|nr:hypothetical protein [Petroclostridium xylanilyticum]MBZ4646025.1 siderophore/surfactin biosynthesis protein [Clostridia bacterium]